MTALPAHVWSGPPRLPSRAERRDADAFAAAYERHHRALYRYCRSILRDDQDAQDALQNAMTKAFVALQDETRDFELRPWLFRIAHNEAITLLRQRRGAAALDDATPASGELEDQVAEREELRLLWLDLKALPERQRAALVLRELNGLSHVEIGTVLDLSISGVKQALFDARTALSDSRDGRALACEAVRRTLSDGDGRVLRRRTVRAHLRSCTECRGFRAELSARPKALRLLVPPLPAVGAAGLASSLFGGSAVKLLACVALAGGGSTVAAVGLQHARVPARAAAAERTPDFTPARASAAVTAAPSSAASVRLSALAGTKPVATAERGTPATPSKRRSRPPRRAKASPTPTSAPSQSAPTPRDGVRHDEAAVAVEPRGANESEGEGTRSPESSGNNGSARAREPVERPVNTGNGDKSVESPGNSGNAPGRAGGPPGNSENAPSRTADTPGNNENPPGQPGEVPGQSANAPGNSGTTLGLNAGANGNSGGNRNGDGGSRVDAPGQTNKPDKPS